MHGDWASYNRNKEAMQKLQPKDIELCCFCGGPFEECPGTDGLKIEVQTFDSPFDEVPIWRAYGSYECMTNDLFHGNDFSYFECVECGRIICYQHPNNGWRGQCRTDEDGYEICIACYQKETLKNGHSEKELETGVPGEFFDVQDVKAAGWRELSPYYTDMKVDGGNKDSILLALKHQLDVGRKVLVNYQRLAYGGSEGYITVFAKDPEVAIVDLICLDCGREVKSGKMCQCHIKAVA